MRNIIILKYNEHHIRGNDRNTEEGQLSKSRQNGDARKGRDGLSEPHNASLTALGHRGGKVFQTRNCTCKSPEAREVMETASSVNRERQGMRAEQSRATTGERSLDENTLGKVPNSECSKEEIRMADESDKV